jgi:bacterioferritin (cytochrome b1)
MPQPPPTRRDVLRVGATVAGAAAVSACGGDGSASRTGAPTRSAAAAPDPVHVLNQALVVEHTTVFAYTLGLPLLGSVTSPMATAFRQHHSDHRDLLIRLIRGLGGTPTPARDSYDIGAPPTDEGGMVSLAATLEEQAARAGFAALRQLDDPATQQTLGSILGDEAQHAAAWRTLLQQDPAPASFVSA